MPDSQTLYNRWVSTLNAHRNDIALVDIKADRKYTFSDLDELLKEKPSTNAPVIAKPTGADFLVRTLWAWREKVPFCPIDECTQLDMNCLTGIPAGIAHVKLTSGTTGDPRLVLFTEPQLEADADNINKSMQLTDFGSNIGVISLVHSYGFSSLILPLLLHGIPLIIGESPLPESLNHAFSQAIGQVILPGVPAMWSAWHKSAILENLPIGLAVSAGAPLSVDLEKEILLSSGLKVHNFYGSSECGGIAYDSSEISRENTEVVGHPLDGVHVDYCEDGRLIVRSSATAEGYWPKDLSGSLGNGAFYTADLAQCDSETGAIKIIGRTSEIINVAGRKLSPIEVEEVLMGIEGVELGVVFGIPSADENRVEDIVACFSAKNQIDHKNLAREMRKKLLPWKVPKIFWQRNGLNISNRGKILRGYWKQEFLNRDH